MTVASELTESMRPDENQSMIESELNLGAPKIVDVPTGVTGAKPSQNREEEEEDAEEEEEEMEVG
jgi:hypothetical protein